MNIKLNQSTQRNIRASFYAKLWTKIITPKVNFFTWEAWWGWNHDQGKTS